MKATEQHVDALEQSKNNENAQINRKKSESFKKLTNSDKLKRINGAVNLLQQFKELNVAENQVCVLWLYSIEWNFFFFRLE